MQKSSPKRSSFVTNQKFLKPDPQNEVHTLLSAQALQSLQDVRQLPLEWLLTPGKGTSLSERILARLIQSEAHESNPSLRQDWRQAWIVVSLAAKDDPNPFVTASYRCYGVHPDKLFVKLTAMRKAKLGPEYEKWFDAAGNLRPDLPKKPSESIAKERKEDAA